MNNIEKIRQEIERLKIAYLNRSYTFVPATMEQLLDFIDSLPEEKPSEDLEEAAEELFETIEIQEHENIFEDTFKKIFIAGAEWQARQLLKGSPLPEDTVLFHKGVEEGKRLMMEDAVEGEIGYWNQRGLSIRLDQSLERLGYGEDTEVKIIIVKDAAHRK